MGIGKFFKELFSASDTSSQKRAEDDLGMVLDNVPDPTIENREPYKPVSEAEMRTMTDTEIQDAMNEAEREKQFADSVQSKGPWLLLAYELVQIPTKIITTIAGAVVADKKVNQLTGDIASTSSNSDSAQQTLENGSYVLDERQDSYPYGGYSVTPSISLAADFDGNPRTLPTYDLDPVTGQLRPNPTLEDAMKETRAESESPCFARGTLIQTPFGETPIENLKVGDKVMAFDPLLENGRGRLVAKEITQVFLNRTTEFMKLAWEEDGVTKEVVTTPGHHFLREDARFGTEFRRDHR